MEKGKSRWTIVKKWFCARLREKTTWLGILGILTAFCILPFDESTTSYVATFLGSLGGLISVLWQEKPKRKRKVKKPIAKIDDSDDKTTITLD